jgi:hypothetical protein
LMVVTAAVAVAVAVADDSLVILWTNTQYCWHGHWHISSKL